MKNLPPIPKLPPPRSQGEAFRAGLRGAPFVMIDNLAVIPLIVTRAPGPNLLEVERLRNWPPAGAIPDIREVYALGRAIRGVALVLDRWNEGSTAILHTSQILLDHGALHLRLRQPYRLNVLLEDYERVLRSFPDRVRRNQSVESLLNEVSAYAKKQHAWDEYDF